MLVRPFSWAIVLVGLFLTPARGQEADKTTEAKESADARVLSEVGQLIQSRQYEQAVAAIDQALAGERPDEAYLMYLRGRALHFHGDYDAAVAAFDDLLNKHPDCAWSRQASFAKAVAYVRKGDFPAAEKIYREQAQHLLSSDRKQELATIFLEFGDAYFSPEGVTAEPNFAQAQKFYEKAIQMGLPKEKDAGTRLRIGKALQNQDNYAEAAKRYQALVDQFENKPVAAEIVPHLVEARYQKGWCELRQGQHAEARRSWQDLLSSALAERLQEESDSFGRLAEASYYLAQTYGVPTPGSEEDLDLGVAALTRFLEQYPKHELAGQAQLRIIQSFMHLGRHVQAAEAIETFLAKPGQAESEIIAEARYALGTVQLAQRKYDAAIKAWGQYLAKHPAHKHWAQAQSQIIDAEYLAAHEARKDKDFAEARRRWQQFLVKYPLDSRAASIWIAFGDMDYEKEKYDAAIDQWKQVVSKYPGTDAASHAQYLVAETLAQKLGELEKALAAYKELTWGSYHGRAQQRIAALTKKSLQIVTPRVFRSDEAPKIKLTSRNIESFDVKVYSVDMETYFRKMHLASGVESLDVALIDPDESFEFEIPDYEELKETKNDVEIPWKKGTAALAVTVSSETLEATTLVLRSDLDMIVKSSRDEVFIFVQNMRTGKPWKDARLLISNGGEVFAEARTNEDGVLQQSFEELKSTNDIRVFAISGEHVASNVLGLSGLGASQGLANKGFLLTERPVYQPGQMVHVRGIIRRVADDRYVVDEGKQFDFEVLDPRGRKIWEAKVALSRFGTFHTNFVLPTSVEQGAYRLLAKELPREGKTSYQGQFQVESYQLQPIRVTIDSERQVYYRGEEITGVIRAAYYYGAPLVDKEIRYQLADGAWKMAQTDEKGEVAFTFETEEFRETQTLPVTAILTERSITTQKPLVLATRGFAVSFRSPRDTYLTGESFETKITTMDAAGEPVARKLKVELVQKTVVNGQQGERVVASQDITTDEEGSGLVTFQAKEGGNYMVRALGTDRFENPISAQTAYTISGEEDELRLRILADTHTYTVGDEAKIRVHWREAPSLALVTYQGAKVLGYQLVPLKKGENSIHVPMGEELAPNFDFHIALMLPAGDDEQASNPTKRFHEASSPFQVERAMHIAIDVKPLEGQTADPGEEVEVTLTATDSQGQPLSAELSLALIEQALLDRFGGMRDELGGLFAGARRESAVRTVSSIAFRYKPETAAISKTLLAERERLESEEMEVAALAEIEDRAESMAISGAYGGYGGGGYGGAAGGGAMGGESGYGGGLGGPPPPNASFATPTRESRANEPMSETMTRQLASKSIRAHAFYDDVELQRKYKEGEITEEFFKRVQDARRRGVVNDAYGFVESAPGHMTWEESQLGRVSGDANAEISLSDFDADGLVAGVPLAANRAVIARRFGDDNGRLNKWGSAQNEAIVLEKGLWQLVVLNGSADEVEAKLPAAGRLFSGLHSPETGYWNPAIETDEQGKATVRVVLPNRSTAWQWIVGGITTGSLAGDAITTQVAKKQLFGDLKLPSALVDGDEVQVGASVHSTAKLEGEVSVSLTTRIGNWKQTSTEKITVKDGQPAELSFRVKVDRQAAMEAEDNAEHTAARVDAMFELTVDTGERKDVVVRQVPVLPLGRDVVQTTGGTATADASTTIELPADMQVADPRLTISVAPSVTRSLLDVVLAPQPIWGKRHHLPRGMVDSHTSTLLASLSLKELVGQTNKAMGPEEEALDSRIRAALGSLIAVQQEDGGWVWTGRPQGKQASDPFVSARVLWSLSRAKQDGYVIARDGWEKAIGFVRDQLVKADANDYETRAVLVHALASAGQGDFAQANRLYRARGGLSPAAAAYTALAFLEMDRKEIAEQMVAPLLSRDWHSAAEDSSQKTARMGWNQSAIEARSLFALALAQLGTHQAELRSQVDWLLAARTGNRWSPDKATGPATMAAALWMGTPQDGAYKYRLAITVNDYEVETLEIDTASATTVVEVPSHLLDRQSKSLKQTVRFQLIGRGEYSFQVALGGFVPSDKLVSTSKDWGVHRYVEAAPRERDGKELPRGFGIVQGSYRSFRNLVSSLPVGQRAMVSLYPWRSSQERRRTEQHLPYLVLVEPIPSGATVVEDSIRGHFESYRIEPGVITFFIGNRRDLSGIHYELHGYLPGEYQRGTTVVQNAYAEGEFAVVQGNGFEVLPFGEASKDEYRLTPQELLALGEWHENRGEYAEAVRYLGQLLQDWNVRPDPYRKAIEILLHAHLEVGPSHKVVQYFEIVKEKWPEIEIPFDNILKIGAAYHELGEYERSYMIFRATVESRFMEEIRVAGFLAQENEFLQSVSVTDRLLREYPPESYVAAARYGLAQQVYTKAVTAAQDAKLRERKITRVNLVQQAIGMLDQFLTLNPEDPAADQAAFSLATAFLELQQYERVVTTCHKFLERYPQSKFHNAFRYTIGFSHFALAQHEKALELCQQVADEEPEGTAGKTDNQWRAIYILGQIYHSLGDAAEAVKEYTRVADRFPDAQQAIDYFTRKSIRLPEVTTLTPQENKTVKLGYRNLTDVDVRVYGIDLMKFGLLKRNLENIRSINLAGIRPTFEQTFFLGDGADYRDRDKEIELPLDKVGAYLIVARGADLHASGLVLVSPLEVEVQQDSVSGRLRVTVKDTEKDEFLSDVHVKVIGSANDQFNSGETDLRGIYIADGVQGTATVIAQGENGEYAFYRGQTPLGTNQPGQRAADKKAAAVDRFSAGKDLLLEGINTTNGRLQQRGQQQLFEYYGNSVQGVQVEKAR